MTDALLAAGEGLLTIDSFEWKAEQVWNTINIGEQPIRGRLKIGRAIRKIALRKNGT
jgi:hypothetical protein